MKKEEFLDAIGKIDDKLILEAVNDAALGKEKKNAWPRWAAIAAVFVLVVCAFHLLPENPSIDEKQELPMLEIAESTNEGMGYEGYMAYDFTELVNANPWSETAELYTLPVYKNPLSYDDNFFVSGVDLEAMKALLLEVAERLGMDTDVLEIGILPDSEELADMEKKMGTEIPEGSFDPMTRVVAEADGIKIEVDTALIATITFEPPIALPEGYNFYFGTSYADVSVAAGYLEENYCNLLKMEEPEINIWGGDYTTYGEQQYYVSFFDKGGDLAEQIINYNFNQVHFYCNENREVDLVRIYQPDLSDKVGDYPIISEKEATKLLLDGSYFTTVPYEMPGREYIAKTELVYRTQIFEKYFMPYYRFYVELPEDEMEDGMKTYGVYYVPAVRGEYIAP